jgi:hypothetical protein
VKEDSWLIFWMDQTNTALHNQVTQLLRCSLFFCVVGKAEVCCVGQYVNAKGDLGRGYHFAAVALSLPWITLLRHAGFSGSLKSVVQRRSALFLCKCSLVLAFLEAQGMVI